MIDKTALGAIKCYKKFISPYKGFRCAYGSVHGISCSTVAENLIKEHGVIKARPLIKQQFAECRAVYESLKGNKNQRECDCDLVPMNCTPTPIGCCGSRSGRSEIDCVDCDIGDCE